jgi:hypothetical protein
LGRPLFFYNNCMQNDKENQKSSLSWSTPTPTQPSLTVAKAASAPKTASVAPVNSKTGTYVGILAGGIILGVLLSWGWSAARGNPQPVATTKSATTAAGDNNAALTSTMSSNEQTQTDSSLLVNSPQKAGDSVMIASVSVAKPTWVVVYEENNGKPGNALGARLFQSDAENQTVNLLRDTTPGEQYLVGESLDDGTHMFSLKDTEVTENGQTLWVAFTAQ